MIKIEKVREVVVADIQNVFDLRTLPVPLMLVGFWEWCIVFGLHRRESEMMVFEEMTKDRPPRLRQSWKLLVYWSLPAGTIASSWERTTV